MSLLPIFWEWAEFALRWVHVITAIAWIGSSFYFIALDLGLHPSSDRRQGVSGEEWQVHGGGFYFIQKYMVAPARMPEDLVWFKWESYATWLSGAALMAVVYYLGAELYLVDPNVLEMAPWVAVIVSIVSLSIGWILYDLLCKSKFGDDNTRLMIFLYIILVAMAWGYTQIFSGRAAFLHLGAFTATVMSANVFFIIIPNQKIVVADLKAGRTPDPKYGKIAKQRSTHNNYLTLPVLFMMLSNHYPLAFASKYNWIIAALVFLMGVTIRHFFNTMHKRGGMLWWTWGLTTALFLAVMWLSTAGIYMQDDGEDEAALGPMAQKFAAAEGFEDVHDIVVTNCSMCHAKEPYWEGMASPPKGIRLETTQEVATLAKEIWLQAGVTHAMPPAGSYMYLDEDSRMAIRKWYEGALEG
ncbi:urate hydroxylase PuuD [Celeribacter sp. PS-C1]|uniref:urate hydroxylase PuuD n=1 Tax=Celeribacter sp. PS-C1 TaxID=2820813 RepID=UPI001C67DA7C|nr:urate hydroxylase PuuD [Celeribacter sp. PS-C1]MBW6418048.1 urate hydroxylase PuuD [Celeribacter sp. PS-C1]